MNEREKRFRDLLKGKETLILEEDKYTKLILVKDSQMVYSIANENCGASSCTFGSFAYYKWNKADKERRGI